MKTAQQGDVLFKRVTQPPSKEAKVTKLRHYVVAHGESGHSHILEAEDEFELIQEGERILLSLEKSATVVHEEHAPITLDKGLWEVGRVREYDYFQEMVRKVAD